MMDCCAISKCPPPGTPVCFATQLLPSKGGFFSFLLESMWIALGKQNETEQHGKLNSGSGGLVGFLTGPQGMRVMHEQTSGSLLGKQR